MRLDLWQARRRFLMRAAILAWTVTFGAMHVIQVAVPDRPGKVAWDARMQLRWLERSLSNRDASFSQKVFPEGELFLWEFYGLALENVAETTRDPADVEKAVREVRRMLPTIDGMLSHPPFDVMAHAEVRGGICWFAGQNLLRARMIALAKDADPAEVERFHADSAQLEQAFRRSAIGVLQAHPGMSWPVDSLFGYRSLQIHDRLYGTHYFDTFTRYEQAMRRIADPATGLMPSFVYLDGRPRDIPRGCAMSWSLAVLPDLDPAFAAEEWSRYRASFGRCAGGLCLFREYPAGTARPADSDSGPIIAGLGMSASAFALASARAVGNVETAESLRRTGELFGFPAVSWWGKRYLGGEVSMFDVLSVWTRTVPLRSEHAGSIAWTPLLGLAAFWSALALLALRALRRARAELQRARGESPYQKALHGAAAAALAIHLVVPSFIGAFLMIAWTFLDLLGRFGASRARGGAPAEASPDYPLAEEAPR
jgi:hypothetical protein